VASVLVSLLHSLRFLIRSRAALHLENHGAPTPARRGESIEPPAPSPHTADRQFWTWLSQAWHGWRSALHIVRPETVIRWHRRAFRMFWTWKSQKRTGRPGVPLDVRMLTARSRFGLCRGHEYHRRHEHPGGA
jgi:hypothetical protein